MEAIRLRREGVNILGPKPKRNSNVGWKLRLFLEGWVSDANYLNLKSKQVGKKEGKESEASGRPADDGFQHAIALICQWNVVQRNLFMKFN